MAAPRPLLEWLYRFVFFSVYVTSFFRECAIRGRIGAHAIRTAAAGILACAGSQADEGLEPAAADATTATGADTEKERAFTALHFSADQFGIVGFNSRNTTRRDGRTPAKGEAAATSSKSQPVVGEMSVATVEQSWAEHVARHARQSGCIAVRRVVRQRCYRLSRECSRR